MQKETDMKNFAFISRHVPTPEQHTLAENAGIVLTAIGDTDAFTVASGFIHAKGPFEGVVVVHPAAAMRLCSNFVVGIFENGTRPSEGDKPQFFAKALHIYDMRD